MKRYQVFAIAVLLAAGCGRPNVSPSTENATLHMTVTAEGVDLRPYAADETAEILNSVRPVSLQFLICDNIQLTEQIRTFCTAEEGFNFKTRVEAQGNSGSLQITGIPPARDQVVIAQGIAADDKITYEGFVTVPTIQPRGEYSIAVNLKQTAFPPLPAPDAPVLTQPASTPFTVPTDQSLFVFEGTREPDTKIRITIPDTFGLGNFEEYTKTEAPLYEETEFDDRIEWSYEVDVSVLNRSVSRNYVFSFSAARRGEDKYSDDVSVTMRVCAKPDDGMC